MLKCSKCGSEKFNASQAVRGTVTVIVTLTEEGAPIFDSNPTEDGQMDVSGLDFDDPEGPFECLTCGQVMPLPD